MRKYPLIVVGFLLASALAWAQTHTVLTNDQQFTVPNGRSLTGTYQCSGAGTIDDCAISGATITDSTFGSGNTGFPTPLPTATPVVIPTAATFPTPFPTSTPSAPYDLTNVTGNLGVSHLNSGTNADANHFWSGAGTWLLPVAFQWSSRSATTNLSNSATSYLIAQGSTAASATEADVQLITRTGTAGNMGCFAITAVPGVGTSWTVTLRKEGADTASTCTIADNATSCSDNTNTVAFVGGERVNYKIVPSGSPTASIFLCGHVEYGSQ